MPTGVELLLRLPWRDSPLQPLEPAHQLLPREPNFCDGLGLAEREWEWRAVCIAWVVAGAASLLGDDLATVALVLLRLGGRGLAARQRRTAPAGRVSRACMLQDSWGELASPWFNPNQDPLRVV